MADMFNKSRELTIKKLERDKLQSLTNIQSKEIRLLELEEEMERVRFEIRKQNEVIQTCEENIKQQQELIKQEDAEAAK